MNHYELTMILRPELAEKDIQKLAQEMGQLLAGMSATVVSTRTERRGLAHPVKKQTEATYLHVVLTGPNDIPARVRGELKHREEIMRMVFTRLPELPPAEPAPVPAPEPAPEPPPAPEAANG